MSMGFMIALDCSLWVGVRIGIDFPEDMAWEFTFEGILRVIHMKTGMTWFDIGTRTLQKHEIAKYILRKLMAQRTYIQILHFNE